MCGIIGYVGKDKAIDVLQSGLKILEYRGYDSAGICVFNGEKCVITKKAGTVDNLFKYVQKTNVNVGIGHTRWATHGIASDNNSHPHKSMFGRVNIVHNGIIENYNELLQTQLKGVKLNSQTDTEVVANLLEKNYILTGDKLKAISQTIKNLKGSYAIAIMFADDSNNLYFTKNISPLLIGVGETENFVSSDVLGFNKYTKKYIEIEDKTLGVIGANYVQIFDTNLNKIKYKHQLLPLNFKNTDKNGYPFYMIKEINEVPNVIFDTSDYFEKHNVLENINKNFWQGIKRIKLVACGTSYHACLIGEHILNDIGLDASSYIASEFIYSKPLIDKNTLCIFVSQSGETADTLSAVKIAKQKRAKTLCITNVETSNITKLCDYVLPTKCGREVAVASTKAYNGQLSVFYLLSGFLQKNYKNPQKIKQKLNKTTKKLKILAKKIKLKQIEQNIKPIIKAVLDAKTVFMVGRQGDYVTSLESALKLKEITYINCQGYASGELKHGTISLVDENTLVFAFVTDKSIADKTLNVIRQTQSRGAKICVVTCFKDILQDASIDYKIELPVVQKQFYPLVAILPMQLLSYHTSVALGYNPDKPRNLAKSVTVE